MLFDPLQSLLMDIATINKYITSIFTDNIVVESD